MLAHSFVASLALFVGVLAVTDSGTCNICTNNACIQAVLATSIAKEDCSSFFQTTVYPASSTTTTLVPTLQTTTTTVDSGETVTVVKRQNTVIPSDIPQYATACAATADYSSACSCLGVSPATITEGVTTTTTTASATPEPTSSTTSTTATTTTTTSAAGSIQTVSLAGLTYIDAFLEAHNTHRANHTEVDLVWSADLATYAGETAATCVYQHSLIAGGGGYGQNIAAGFTNLQAPTVLNLWYNAEVNNYPQPYGNDNPDLSNFAAWGHFSQVAWSTSTSVGCATQYCPNGLTNAGAGVSPYFTVCNYSPAGNYVGQFSKVLASLRNPTVVFTV